MCMLLHVLLAVGLSKSKHVLSQHMDVGSQPRSAATDLNLDKSLRATS